MELKKHVVITGTIKCITGLHIGGSALEMGIGNVDLPIIRHPVTKEPYIPGSSLKGKMRSELEKKYNKSKDGEPCGCREQNCFVCRIFGPHKRKKEEGAQEKERALGPTRILVRDCPLSQKSREEYTKLIKEKDIGFDYIEKKTENIIDRRTGAALHPRTQERVPAGAEFDMEIILLIFDNDKEEELKKYVKEGIELVEKTYLGGSGSRGYGKVKFLNLKADGKDF